MAMHLLFRADGQQGLNMPFAGACRRGRGWGEGGSAGGGTAGGAGALQHPGGAGGGGALHGVAGATAAAPWTYCAFACFRPTRPM
jgi:hypothetical protein